MPAGTLVDQTAEAKQKDQIVLPPEYPQALGYERDREDIIGSKPLLLLLKDEFNSTFKRILSQVVVGVEANGIVSSQFGVLLSRALSTTGNVCFRYKILP